MMLVHGLLTLFRSHFFSILGETGGLFLERSDNERAREAVVVYMQDRGFNGYADNMIKLSVNAIQFEIVCLQAPFRIFAVSYTHLTLPTKRIV